jgi:hypothetical protein
MQIISRRLTTHQLRRLQETDVALGYDELFIRAGDKSASPYFLGYYSPSGLKYALEKYGFFKLLQKKGFDDLKITINTKDPYKQCLALHDGKKDRDHLLCELIVKRKNITVYPPFPATIYGRNYEVIAIEWLLMQDPRTQFPKKRPRLPGQKYPGLGMGEMVMELLVIMSGRLRTAGLVNKPEHFHNAQMYSSHFSFIDPIHEAKRQAIARDLLKEYSLSEISWAMDLKCVMENGKPFQWQGSDQIIPLDRDLKEYLCSAKYKNIVANSRQDFQYQIDIKKWERKKIEIFD